MGFALAQHHKYQNEITRELFVNTADENYVTARFCFTESLYTDFYWLAVHCIEKYLKAVLAINEHSTKKYNHDICRLYDDVHKLASDLLPCKCSKPDIIDVKNWIDETPRDFLRRIYSNGDANNRYQIYGYVQQPDDIFKLDHMVFSVRRLSLSPMDAYYYNDETYRELLARQQETPLPMPNGNLEKMISGARGARLRDIACNRNLFFAPEDYEHTKIKLKRSVRRPVLLYDVLEPLMSGTQSTKDVASLVLNWVLKYISLPADVRKDLEKWSQ